MTGRQISFATPIEYFSIRFTSPKDWIIWDDALDQQALCYSECWGYIPDINLFKDHYYSFSGVRYLNDSILTGFHSTPYRTTAPSNSSVVFIPGLEASRLYIKGDIYEDQLWEPNRHQDVQDLYLDQNGQSIKPNIYTSDIIDEINYSPIGQSNIYKSFIKMMKGLKTDGTIANWKALPYDWRFDLPEVVANANMLAEIETMAITSNTGKVTIIAHSNGGLVAKELPAASTESA